MARAVSVPFIGLFGHPGPRGRVIVLGVAERPLSAPGEAMLLRSVAALGTSLSPFLDGKRSLSGINYCKATS
jgi:hypothetical protein